MRVGAWARLVLIVSVQTVVSRYPTYDYYYYDNYDEDYEEQEYLTSHVPKDFNLEADFEVSPVTFFSVF